MPPFGNFFVGRYGYDQLTFFLIILNFILGVVGRLFFAPVISVVASLLFMVAIFRVFSRNIERRRRENELFLKFFYPIKDWLASRKQGAVPHTQPSPPRNEYKYFKCPGCKNQLRVPRRQGKIFITCPKCGERFKGKS